MRIVLSLVALTLAVPAFAQQAGETVVMVETTTSDRFPDADVAGASFEEGQEVTVLYVTADRLRVRRGDQYGWIAKASAVATAPPAALEDEVE